MQQPDLNVQPRVRVSQRLAHQAPAAPAGPASPAPAAEAEAELEEGEHPPEADQGLHDHDLFRNPTVVYQDHQLTISVKRKEFKRQVRFKLDDILFSMTIKKKRLRSSSVQPLLLTLLESLHRGLTKIIKELQRHYSGNNHQLYVTICENRIQHGLNTGNYSIREKASVISYASIDALYYYLQVGSNK